MEVSSKGWAGIEFSWTSAGFFPRSSDYIIGGDTNVKRSESLFSLTETQEAKARKLNVWYTDTDDVSV